MATVVEKLAKQIGLIQQAIRRPFDPDPTFNADITQRCAQYLADNGTTDVRDLRSYKNQAADLAFFFDIKTAHVYPNFLALTTQWQGDPHVTDLFFYTPGRFDNYFIYLVFSPDGYPIFACRREKQVNQWAEAFRNIAMLAGIAVSAGFAGFAMEIGTAVMGAEAAAAYPAVAQAIGNIAISTTLSGGDVKSAVTSALAGGLGGVVGGAVTGVTDSAMVGAAASAATKAAIVGGDITQAAALSFASSGVNSASSLFTDSPAGAPTMKLGDDDFQIDYGAPSYPSDANADYTDPVYYDAGQGGYEAGGVVGYHDPAWSVNGTPEGATVPMPGATTPPAGPSGVVSSMNGNNLTQLALTALRTVTSWNAAGQPPIRTTNSAVRANNDGTLTTASGQRTQMPPGTPYLTADGSLITNNGDGTYTAVRANGSIATTAYQGTSIFGGRGIALPGLGTVPPVVLLGAAGLAAVLLLGGSRR